MCVLLLSDVASFVSVHSEVIVKRISESLYLIQKYFIPKGKLNVDSQARY